MRPAQLALVLEPRACRGWRPQVVVRDVIPALRGWTCRRWRRTGARPGSGCDRAGARTQLALQLNEARSQFELQLTEAKSQFELQLTEARSQCALRLSEANSRLDEQNARYQVLASSRPVLVANWLRRMFKVVGLRK